MLALFSPLVLCVLGGAFLPWPYRAAPEAGVVGFLALMGLAGVVISVRRWSSRSRGLRASSTVRHPTLLLIGSFVFLILGSATMSSARGALPPKCA